MADFRAHSFPLRVHAGADALRALPAELHRAGARRPLVLSGPSVHARTDLPARLAALCSDDANHGASTAEPAWFSGLGKEAPLSAVLQAVATSREHGADALVAVGAGSVLKAARVVAILLAEDRPIDELVTRYPASGPAVSARLAAPKLPIFNVPTAASTAMARAGSAIASDDGRQRLEFYDPKTRPRAVFWDEGALMTAPHTLARSTGAAIYWRALMSISAIDRCNPLAAASRRQAWTLSQQAMQALASGSTAAQPRVDLCAAALLQVRDEDDGGAPMQAHRLARLVYALGAALFTLKPAIAQAAAYAALTPAAVRVLAQAAEGGCAGASRDEDREVRQGMAYALGLPGATSAALADALCADFARLGQPTALHALGLLRSQLGEAVKLATRNFNADRQREFNGRAELLQAVLEAAW